MNPSSPESIIASARALAAMGSHREAECVLRGALARLPSQGAFRLALMSLSVDAAAGSWPPLSILLVEQWIRDGMLVEALAALSGCSLGEDGQRWANLLGELLAPPPRSSHEHVDVHQSLLRGGASVAMTTLEDMSRSEPLDPWAERRLKLLRWMLIDNAQAAPRDSQVDVCASPLAKALFAPLDARDLTRMANAARSVDHFDAGLTTQALERLAQEVEKQGSPDAADRRTLQHHGRSAAAMQLRMTAFESARAVYEQMLTKAAEPEVAQLLLAVQGIERVLIGRPFSHRTSAIPKASRFDDITVRHPDQRALAGTPAAIGGARAGLGFDDQTRVAALAELPLAAFGDDETRAIVLPEARIETSPERKFGDEVTRVDARLAVTANDVDFNDVTVRGDIIKSPTPARASSFAFVTGDTLAIEDAHLPSELGDRTARDVAPDVAPDVPSPAPPRPVHSTGTAPLGTISEELSSAPKQTKTLPEPMHALLEPTQPSPEPELKRPSRNSVIVAAIVPVGAPENGSTP